MKIIKLITMLGLILGISLSSFAQATNNTAGDVQPNLITNKFNLVGLFNGSSWNVIGRVAQDGVAYIENTATTNAIVQLEGGVLYAESTHKMGGFANVFLPVGGTNSIFGAGFGVAYIDHNLYDATLNGRIGDTYNLPFIRIPVYMYVESGGGWNISKNEAIAQAFAGGLIKVPVSSKWELTVGGAIGTISDYPGNILAGGGSVTYHF